jgi:hypothetical protein
LRLLTRPQRNQHARLRSCFSLPWAFAGGCASPFLCRMFTVKITNIRLNPHSFSRRLERRLLLRAQTSKCALSSKAVRTIFLMTTQSARRTRVRGYVEARAPMPCSLLGGERKFLSGEEGCQPVSSGSRPISPAPAGRSIPVAGVDQRALSVNGGRRANDCGAESHSSGMLDNRSFIIQDAMGKLIATQITLWRGFSVQKRPLTASCPLVSAAANPGAARDQAMHLRLER